MNPYFQNPIPVTIEINDDLYYGTIYDRPNGRKAAVVELHTEEGYIKFAKRYIFGYDGRKLRFYICNTIAGSPVIDRHEKIGELLSHNSDKYYVTYLYN